MPIGTYILLILRVPIVVMKEVLLLFKEKEKTNKRKYSHFIDWQFCYNAMFCHLNEKYLGGWRLNI